MSARFGGEKREGEGEGGSGKNVCVCVCVWKKERPPPLSAPPTLLTRAELPCPAGDVVALRLEAGDGLCFFVLFRVFLLLFSTEEFFERRVERFFVVVVVEEKHATSSFEFLSPPKKLPLSLVLSLSLSLFLLACASSSTVTPTSPRKLETSERVRPSRKKRSEQKKITSERRDSAPVLQSRGVGALPGRRRPLADAGLRVGELRGELSQVDPVGGGGHGVLSQELLLIATAKKNGKERRGVKLKD